MSKEIPICEICKQPLKYGEACILINVNKPVGPGDVTHLKCKERAPGQRQRQNQEQRHKPDCTQHCYPPGLGACWCFDAPTDPESNPESEIAWPPSHTLKIQ
jgi:hypothetical protein